MKRPECRAALQQQPAEVDRSNRVEFSKKGSDYQLLCFSGLKTHTQASHGLDVRETGLSDKTSVKDARD